MGVMSEMAIPILRVDNADAAVAWYERLGFSKQWEHRFEPGLPAFVEIDRGGVKLFLSEHRGDASPDTLVYLVVSNLDAIAAEFGVSPEDMPWGRREVRLRDCDGNRLRLASPAGTTI
jgi:catechol 2,3-dioxygenase-like lactoylglutathione lyase family enzyme